MIRYYIILILTTNSLITCGQISKKGIYDKTPLDFDRIDKIQISKRSIQPDTNLFDPKNFTQDQIILFCDKWNRDMDGELRKYFPSYDLTVYLKSGALRKFRVGGRFIKEKNDYCIDILDENFFHELYNNANDVTDTSLQKLQTGWYYISEEKTAFERQLDKTSEYYYLDPNVIIPVNQFIKFELTDSKFQGEKYPILIIYFNTEGTENWSIATEKMIGKQLALVINDKLIITPKVNSQITAGVSAINRLDYSKQELEEILTTLERKYEK